MIDIFKKGQEAQTTDTPQACQQQAPTKNQEVAIIIEDPTQTQMNGIEDLTATLENLKQEESNLLNQKQRLQNISEQLRLRTVEEIEKTKVRITSLKSEIPELKHQCEAFTKALGIPLLNSSD